MTHFHVLTLLRHHDAMPMGRLAEILDASMSSTTGIIDRMEEKGLVAHTEQGRQFLYRARLAPEQVQKNLVGDLVSRLFDGDPLELVSHLLRAGEIEPDELDDLRRRVVDAERKQKKERS